MVGEIWQHEHFNAHVYKWPIILIYKSQEVKQCPSIQRGLEFPTISCKPHKKFKGLGSALASYT